MKKSNTILDTLSSEELSLISNRIKHLRCDILHMTQSEFATTVKISQSYLSFLENGDRDINMSAIVNIATSLRVNLDWLIYGIGSDDNIFASENITKDYFVQSNQASVLKELQKIYSLKPSEIEFIEWYLTLQSKERQEFVKSINTISALLKQN